MLDYGWVTSQCLLYIWIIFEFLPAESVVFRKLKCTPAREEKPQLTKINCTLVDCVATKRIPHRDEKNRSTPAAAVRQLNVSQMISLICFRWLPAQHSALSSFRWYYLKKRNSLSLLPMREWYLLTDGEMSRDRNDCATRWRWFSCGQFFIRSFCLAWATHETGSSLCVCIVHTYQFTYHCSIQPIPYSVFRVQV